MTIRIDRMDLPEVSDEDTVPPPENYNVQDYTDVIVFNRNTFSNVSIVKC